MALDTLNITASKGEFTFTELGNAAFREANVKGSMGEVSLDLRGDYLEDASVVTRFRMGECRLTLPEDMHVEVTSSVSMGDRRVSVNTPDELPADAPRLSVDATLSMGELDIRSAAPEGGTADASIVEVTSIIETPSSETPSSETPSSEALAAPAGLSAPEPAPAPEPPPERRLEGRGAGIPHAIHAMAHAHDAPAGVELAREPGPRVFRRTDGVEHVQHGSWGAPMQRPLQGADRCDHR